MFKFLKNVWKESKISQCSEDTPNTNEKNIGEPVISFVKLLEEQPENFLWKRDIKKPWSPIRTWYKLFDKKNKKMYSYYVCGDFLNIREISFLTHEECQYLFKVHKRRVDNWTQDVKKKIQEQKNTERQQYIDIYCKGQQ